MDGFDLTLALEVSGGWLAIALVAVLFFAGAEGRRIFKRKPAPAKLRLVRDDER